MSHWLRLGFWLLRRERRAGEWRVLLLALAIGVGSITSIGFLGDRLQRALGDRGAGFLGADLVVSSPRPLTSWPAHSLQRSNAIDLVTMVSHGERFQLADLRAVDAAWPLRGTVRIAPRAGAQGQVRPAQPPPGSLYAEASLLRLLDIAVGDRLRVGAVEFRLAGVVVDEPGRIGAVFGLAPRVYLRADELASTGVLLPGSRVSHVYQFAGTPEAIADFSARVRPGLDATQRLTGALEGNQNLRGPFANTLRYIQLTALVSLLLALVAVSLAGRRQALRQFDQAALLRSLGASAGQLRSLYAGQWLLLGLLGSLLGIVLGVAVQGVLATLLLPGQSTRLPDLGWQPAAAGLLTGLIGLGAVSLPILLRLSGTPPLRVLRRDLVPLSRTGRLGVAMGAAALLALVAWYADDMRLTGLFLGALTVLVLVLAMLARAALGLGDALRRLSAGPLRHGLTRMLRHGRESSLQLGAFSLALFLIALLALVRGDLVHGWRQQLPADAPNHFLVNIAPGQVAEVAGYLAAHRLSASALYPMVRGRLTHLNGQPIADVLAPEARDDNTLRRELNLTWSSGLPPGNRIDAGVWHGDRRVAELSVEARMAQRLGLSLGDRLGFQIGDQYVEARIGSLRSLKWESMQPNFFVIFAPGQLDHLPASAMAAVQVPEAAKTAMAGFVQRFPGVTVIALDRIIADIQAVLDQIIAAVQWLLVFLLAAGAAVVVATLFASLDARRQESVLLRTLGATRAYLAGSLWTEFLTLGVLAGLLASAGAELAMAILAERIFELPARLHPGLWLILPLAGALLIGATGWLTSRSITRVPPMQSLRALE